MVPELLKYNGEPDVLQKFEEWDPPKLPVSGTDLMLMGVGKGPRVSFPSLSEPGTPFSVRFGWSVGAHMHLASDQSSYFAGGLRT